MAKEKKISVKYFPQKLKRGENLYNLYCRVVFDRKSTMFSLNFSWSSESKEQAEWWVNNQLTTGKNNAIDLPKRTKWIERIVRREIEVVGAFYTIVGFGERVNWYLSSTANYFSYGTYQRLFGVLKNEMTYNQYISFKKDFTENTPQFEYFKFFDTIEFIETNYDLDFQTIINKSEELLEYLLIAGLLNSFELSSLIKFDNSNSPKLLDRVTLKDWRSSHFSIGDFFVVNKSVESDFTSFAKEQNSIDKIDKFFLGDFYKYVTKDNLKNYDSIDFLQIIKTIISLEVRLKLK